MTNHTITISESLYNKARRIADASSETVDEIIRIHLENALDNPRLALPADERSELEALHFLSDDALWTITREQMVAPKQAQMQTLMDKNTQGTISPDEYTVLSELVEQGQRLMLRKSEAMKLLLQRGHTVILDDLAPYDE
ncbi:MAG: hypothetical protein Q9P01_13900 [Anaerolineae bacterium]|nr:hypothetical protein [Anaerolineae bacterium]MDQ7035877.1 hypothetical protein [Anaerolineae bacterium]